MRYDVKRLVAAVVIGSAFTPAALALRALFNFTNNHMLPSWLIPTSMGLGMVFVALAMWTDPVRRRKA